jgi:hypothetical protein
MTWSEELVSTPAMTLREYYAGRGPWTIADVKAHLTDPEEYNVIKLNEMCVRWNRMYADALIDELQREIVAPVRQEAEDE